MKRFLPFSLLLVTACADGGDEDRLQSDVRISAQHHLFGFRSLRGFGAFPVPANAVFTDRGRLNLFDNSTYTVTRSTGTTGAERYGIETDGELSLIVTGFGNEPTVLFRGGYSLVGGTTSQNDLFFTDRVVTPSSQSIGLYYGTRVVNGQLELEGNWHLLSLHAVFGQTVLSPDNVGRGANGSVQVAAGAAGAARSISGTGTQGTSALTLSGTIQNLLSNGTGDGTCNLTLGYQLTGQAVDSRVVDAAGNDNVVFGLDADESDGESGLVLLVRKFNAPATPVDPVRVLGRFLVGGHTLFVNPSNSGSDAFVGVVTLSQGGGFRLDAVGSQGADFSYVGSYTLNADGGITLTISGTNETWFAAIDRSYNTFALVDGFVEVRANNTPELNLAFGVREQVQ